LRDEKMYSSQLASNVLNYFDFESPHLSSRQKSLCLGFLKAHGDKFMPPGSRTTSGPYLSRSLTNQLDVIRSSTSPFVYCQDLIK
jgi:hypothetical protein